MLPTPLKFKKLVASFLFFFCFLPILVDAQMIPFGGKIIFVKWCTCSQNLYINYAPVLPTMPPALSYRPGLSQLYAYYQIMVPSMEILGIVSNPDVCLTGKHCRPYSPSLAFPPFTIAMVGTSGLGGGIAPPSSPTGAASPSNNDTFGGGQPPINGSGGTGGTGNNAEQNTPANEAANRQELIQNGVNVVSTGNCQDCSNRTCTCVGGTTEGAIDEVIDIRQNCPTCRVEVTGSTEFGHHNNCYGNCVDLQRHPGQAGYGDLDNYIQSGSRVPNGSAAGYNCSDSAPCYRRGDTLYYQEDDAHWHVQYDYFKTGRV